MRSLLPLHRSLLVTASATTLLTLPALGQARRPAAAPARWTVAEATARFTSRITTSMAGRTTESTPAPGTIFVEIRAVLGTRDSVFSAVAADSIYLVLREGTRRVHRMTLAAIGFPTADGTCHWANLAAIIQGGVTTTFASGDGYALNRAEQGGPLTITFQKNPNRTCLLFPAPAGASGTWRLHFVQGEVPLRPPLAEPVPDRWLPNP